MLSSRSTAFAPSRHLTLGVLPLKQHQQRPRFAAAASPAADPPQRLQRVLDAIDALNARDPRRIDVNGEPTPYELAYSRWLSQWVAKLSAADDGGAAPPSDELVIAARGQHVERWTSPRVSYPEGRAGYLKWREELKKAHAATVSALMTADGYGADAAARASRLILKRDLRVDAEAQTLEDALCLVFLERQFKDLRLKEGDDKMVDIVRKTWGKMGEKGRAAALALAPALAAEEAAIVARALAP